MQNKNNKDTVKEQMDSKLTELQDDDLELIAGGLGAKLVPSSTAETCPSFQWCKIEGDIMYIKCCENCSFVTRQFPQVDAILSQNGYALCGLKK